MYYDGRNNKAYVKSCTVPCTVAPSICVLNKKLAAFKLLAPGIRTLFVPVQQFVIFVAICNIYIYIYKWNEVK